MAFRPDPPMSTASVMGPFDEAGDRWVDAFLAGVVGVEAEGVIRNELYCVRAGPGDVSPHTAAA